MYLIIDLKKKKHLHISGFVFVFIIKRRSNVKQKKIIFVKRKETIFRFKT